MWRSPPARRPTKKPWPAADELAEKLTTQDLTAGLLNSAGLSTATLLEIMRENLEIPDSFSLNEARLVLGVQYELSLRKLPDNTYDAYILADDVDTSFISLLSDGGYAGAKISRSTVRKYDTTYAAHILGIVGRIDTQEEKDALGEGYNWDDLVGKSGVEAAFEQYLRGTDGRRVVSVNSDGKITGEYYSTDPQPGNTVELTIDLELQQAVEDALAETVGNMNKEDGIVERGAGAAVVKVGSGEVLSLASYPTYDLSTYRQDIAALDSDPGRPLNNRATYGAYPPGSTFKPLVAVAALEEGVVSLTEKIKDPGRWYYPDIIEGTQTWSWKCWKGGGHGRVNVTQAITASCNTFFHEMATAWALRSSTNTPPAFGLGQPTGIEIGERTAPWRALRSGRPGGRPGTAATRSRRPSASPTTCSPPSSWQITSPPWSPAASTMTPIC